MGQSEDADPYEAGRAATRAALDLPEPRLLMVFASFEYDLARLLAGVAEVAGDVPVIGCSTSGEIGPRPEQANGVVVVGFGGAFHVTTAYATGLHDGARAVGETVAKALLPLPPTSHRVTVMLTDSLAGDTSRQFHGQRILQDSVVAVSIGTEGPIGLSIRHGWHLRGDAMVVTGSTGNSVHTLDDRPALDVYLDRHAAPAGIEHDPAAFTAFALTRPMALARRGQVAIRHVLGADPGTRSLICAASLPKGAAAWLATGDAAATLAAADAACAEAVEELAGVPLLALLVFDCAGRRGVLGDDGCVEERRMMSARAGTSPLAGFYTYGEIARTRGVNGYHNQTIVALALS
ncbi:MAG: hypothetical protein E6G35_09070 [Actinobacteria bacterium]|nr:MAG: hypothetical protein E6G35_09070 [Actinomycetota bacterium]